MKKGISVSAVLVLSGALLTGCCLKHDWEEATCTDPKTCTVCSKTKGEALGHTWTEATCTVPKTCSVCSETEGKALGHIWTEATCTEPKTCDVCRETEGEALGHEWQEANCLYPKTCRICWTTEGNIGDHIWEEATCLAPKTCTVCGDMIGEETPHYFNENGICTMCGASREIQLTMSNVNDFLTVTYTVEEGVQYGVDENYRRIEEEKMKSTGYNWYTVTVSASSDEYVFQNVEIRIGNDYTSSISGKNHADSIYQRFFGGGKREDVYYHLDDEGTVIMEFRHHRRDGFGYYCTIDKIMITDVRGTCIRK